MNTKRKTRDVPARLEGVRRRFERWRQTRKSGRRTPEPLWASAVKVARTYGTSRTAKVLGVDYYALKKRVQQKAAPDPSTPEGGAAATFLELAAPTPAGSGQCTLELEDAGGAKMRLHLQGFEAPDLAALTRSFWDLDS